MEVIFKTKTNSTRHMDVETEKLAKFLIKNKNYLDISFSILDHKRHKITKNMKRTVENNLNFDENLENQQQYDEFVSILSDFYNTDNDTLNARRGALLELLIGNLKPIKKKVNKFNMIEEALVYHKGQAISQKDIDFVFEFDEYELLECKATLTNVLRDPIEDKNIDKLNLMKSTKKILDSYKKQCELYLVTYGNDTGEYLKTLNSDKYEFSDFIVLTGQKIINSLTM